MTRAAGAPGGRRSRRLRRWVLNAWGDGETVQCALRLSDACLVTLTAETLTLDRHPIPGHAGGTYRRDNLRPSCGPCNHDDGRFQALAAHFERRRNP